jgi:hypothetical protein
MRLADYRPEHPLCLTSAPGGYSKSLPRPGVTPTSLARVPGKPQKLLGGELRVSPRHLLCGVSLPGGGTTGVGVDERVEGASGRTSWFVLLDVDQVEQAAQICPLVETYLGVASFDDLNQASDEVEAVRTVIALAVSSVYLQGDWLVQAFLLGARVRPGGRGESPAEPRGYRDPITPIATDG